MLTASASAISGSDKMISVSKSLPVVPFKDVSKVNRQSHGRMTDRAPPVGPSSRRFSDNDIDQALHNTVKDHSQDILKAFQTYDIDNSLSITKGEFRRVLELFCFPLSNAQFQSLLTRIGASRNNTIRYKEFLERFKTSDNHGHGHTAERSLRAPSRIVSPAAPRDLSNIEMLEVALKEKISKNLKNFLKAVRLFDYNRDRKIQRHELRKVIENYVFPLKDGQFDRLWQRHDYHHTGVIDYVEFLNRIGVHVSGQRLSGDVHVMVCVPKSTSHNQRLSRMTFEEVEIEFRQKMKEQYQVLWKTCMSHDPNRDGFISIDELKSILRQFVMPLSDAMFVDLVDRTGIKATGKVPWLTFLQKFRDPQAATNGQTIPIKSNHKANPIRGIGVSTTLDNLLDLLHNHVTNAYSSYRDAFLQLDRNRDGKITRRELRRLLDRFKLSISPEQFKELMIILDPQHTGFITYHHFLGLFEPKESESAHTWLTSKHRYNDKQQPSIMAWQAVEAILAEKITLNWRDFVNCAAYYDTVGEGFIQAEQLRKIIEKVILPVSSEHMADIVKRLKLRDDKNRVNIMEFLSLLGVDVRPLDTEGLSTQIMRSNEESLQLRQLDHDHRMDGIHDQMGQRTRNMTIEEIITRLRDRMKQHKTQIRHSFVSMDKARKGRISYKDFREILESYGLSMKDDQFEALKEHLGFGDNKYLRYLDFLTYFDDPRESIRTHVEVLPKSNHRVNPIRGDEYGMSAERVEDRLRTKLRENFGDLRAAFYKFDEKHQGFLTRKNFRRLLDSFMLITNDEEFEKLCISLNLPPNGRISYPEFLERFEIRDTPQGHKWLVSEHRYNSARPTPLQTVETVHRVLAPLVHQHHQDVARAFCHFDKKGRGSIRRGSFRQLLGSLNLPMDEESFAELWKIYDPQGRGVITFEAFLKHLGIAQQFASGDQNGTSQRIVQESHDAVVRQLEDQNYRQELITQNQATLGTILEDDHVFDAISTRLRNEYKEPSKAFKALDRDQKGYLIIPDFEILLNKACLYVTDEQMMNFAQQIGFNSPDDRLSYERFCTAFDLKASGPDRNLDSGIESEASTEERLSEGTNQDKVESKLRDSIIDQIDIVRKAFNSFDAEGSGRINASDFRRVLDNFCFRLSDSQFKALIKKIQISGDDKVDYIAFLNGFQLPSSQEDWSESVQQEVRAHTPLPIPIDEVESRVHENVSARLYNFAEAFKDLDYASIGVVAKEDFREILHRLVMRMTDDQFNSLWHKLPVNEFGNLEYGKFLSMYGGVEPRPASPASISPPVPSSPQRRQRDQSTDGHQPSSAIFGKKDQSNGPPVELSPEAKLQAIMAKHWKSVYSKCKTIGTNGEMPASRFIGVLRQHGLEMHPNDLIPLIKRFGLQSDGTFRYHDFLRSLVFTYDKEDAKEVKQKLTKARIPLKSRDQSRDLFQCMSRIRHRVLTEWKSMRRSFREGDIEATGFVRAGRFREILNKFGIVLSEDEFYHLMTHYDKDLSGCVNYNSFIKAFLLSA